LCPLIVKGMQLYHDFYFECIAPLMERHFPEVRYSAARLGVGSNVLGFDDHRSPDRDWGPQVDLFFQQETSEQWETVLITFSQRSYHLLSMDSPLILLMIT